MAEKFENPHKFETGDFKTVQVQAPRYYPGRLWSKIIRTTYDTSLHVDIPSFLRFFKVLKREDLKAIHVHFGTNAVQLLPFAKKYKIPLVVTFHGYDASQALADDKYRNKLPALFDYASAIIIVSSHMKDTLDLKRWEKKVHVIPCSVNPDDFPTKIDKETDKIRILHSGRLTGKKGVPDLIRVFQNLSGLYPNIELYIVGDGEEMSKCKELAKKFDLKDSIKFFGAVSHKEVKQIMANADIFVLNSRVDENGDMEGTPVSLLEAMSAKIPVVSTYHAGIPDVVNSGENGLLVPEKDNRALEDALTTLITDRELRNLFAERARETVQKEYTIQQMKQKLAHVFKTV